MGTAWTWMSKAAGGGSTEMRWDQTRLAPHRSSSELQNVVQKVQFQLLQELIVFLLPNLGRAQDPSGNPWLAMISTRGLVRRRWCGAGRLLVCHTLGVHGARGHIVWCPIFPVLPVLWRHVPGVHVPGRRVSGGHLPGLHVPMRHIPGRHAP